MEQQTNFSTQQPSNQPVNVISQRNKKIGTLLFTVPILLLFAVTIFYDMFNLGGFKANTVSIAIVKYIIGLLYIISALGIIIGIPVAVSFLRKKEITINIMYDERSGNGEASIIPNEIKKWNWGAAGLVWIWGIYHIVWISLLALIPIVNLVMIIILGRKGNEWAWKSQKWESVEKFLIFQRKWKFWGIVFMILVIIVMFGLYPKFN